MLGVSTKLALALAALFATAGRAQPALKPSPPANGPAYNANMGRISQRDRSSSTVVR